MPKPINQPWLYTYIRKISDDIGIDIACSSLLEYLYEFRVHT